MTTIGYFSLPVVGMTALFTGAELVLQISSGSGYSHDMSSARTIVDRVAMLYEGEIIWIGGVGQIDYCSKGLVNQFIHRREHGPFALEVA